MYYRDYINHPLNNSPSKQAYSFGKTERFKTTNDQPKSFENNKSKLSTHKNFLSPDQRTVARSTYSSYGKERPPHHKETENRG